MNLIFYFSTWNILRMLEYNSKRHPCTLSITLKINSRNWRNLLCRVSPNFQKSYAPKDLSMPGNSMHSTRLNDQLWLQLDLRYPAINYPAAISLCMLSIFYSFPPKVLLKTKTKWLYLCFDHSISIVLYINYKRWQFVTNTVAMNKYNYYYPFELALYIRPKRHIRIG